MKREVPVGENRFLKFTLPKPSGIVYTVYKLPELEWWLAARPEPDLLQCALQALIFQCIAGNVRYVTLV